ncbi:HNH endonuclease [Spongiimicrobium sp. 2-473A-2-J]|uniref:HNH endonuclease n=1 Tax=Eudoraea algarum TaxID=3417568 RepID=UPI003D364499
MAYLSLDIGADIKLLLLLLGVGLVPWLIKRWRFNLKRKSRRNYYRNTYLKSDEWKRKRYVVLKRDNWKCVYCGKRATQVHHKKYAKKNIGKEPIKWLVSICKSCHDKLH